MLIGAVVHGMEASSGIGPTSFARRPSRGAASDAGCYARVGSDTA